MDEVIRQVADAIQESRLSDALELVLYEQGLVRRRELDVGVLVIDVLTELHLRGLPDGPSRKRVRRALAGIDT